jgi:hypothetical protein
MVDVLSSQAPEHIALALRAHWARYVIPCLVCAILLLAGLLLIAAAGLLTAFPLMAVALYLVGVALVLVGYHKFFHMFLGERMRTIIVTNKRVIYLYIQLYRTAYEHEIPLRRITDMSVHRTGIITYLLNFGSICFDAPNTTDDTTIRRCIPFVPKPDQVSEAIASLLPAAIE